LRYLKLNPPLALQTMDLNLFRTEIDNETLPLIEKAISLIDNDSEYERKLNCSAVYKSFNDLWNLYINSKSHPVNNEEEKNSGLVMANDITDAARQDDGNEKYIPTERTFRPMVRWLLHTLAGYLRESNFHPNLCTELDIELKKCSDKV
jgi:hypothetical protein